MNETMEKLLAAARQGAAQAGDLAVNTAHGLKKKAGETLSAAKQRLRIAALEGEIEEPWRRLVSCSTPPIRELRRTQRCCRKNCGRLTR